MWLWSSNEVMKWREAWLSESIGQYIGDLEEIVIGLGIFWLFFQYFRSWTTEYLRTHWYQNIDHTFYLTWVNMGKSDIWRRANIFHESINTIFWIFNLVIHLGWQFVPFMGQIGEIPVSDNCICFIPYLIRFDGILFDPYKCNDNADLFATCSELVLRQSPIFVYLAWNYFEARSENTALLDHIAHNYTTEESQIWLHFPYLRFSAAFYFY